MQKVILCPLACNILQAGRVKRVRTPISITLKTPNPPPPRGRLTLTGTRERWNALCFAIIFFFFKTISCSPQLAIFSSLSSYTLFILIICKATFLTFLLHFSCCSFYYLPVLSFFFSFLFILSFTSAHP